MSCFSFFDIHYSYISFLIIITLNPSSGIGGGGDYIFLLVFIGIFVGVIGSIGYVSKTKKRRMREEGFIEKNIYNRPRTVVHSYPTQASTSSHTHPHEHEKKLISPQQIAPYEFYCSKCDKKSVGYQVFCPTCGDRMRQPDLATTPETPEKISCVICHSSTCSSCSHDMTTRTTRG